jgi:hypothetical protein
VFFFTGLYFMFLKFFLRLILKLYNLRICGFSYFLNYSFFIFFIKTKSCLKLSFIDINLVLLVAYNLYLIKTTLYKEGVYNFTNNLVFIT